MKIKGLSYDFSIYKAVKADSDLLSDDFCFIGKTDSELSVVCRTEKVPKDCIERDDGWKCFRIEGTLDFSLVGILSAISKILADARIGIFAVSTYDTDYILVKKDNFKAALNLLAANGYEIL